MSNTLGARYIDAWNSHDASLVGEFMADDVDFEDVTLGEVLSGQEAVMDFVDRFGETFSTDYRFDLQTELPTDSTLALEWVVVGTHDRGSPALPATNRPFSIRGQPSPASPTTASRTTVIIGTWPASSSRWVSCRSALNVLRLVRKRGPRRGS